MSGIDAQLVGGQVKEWLMAGPGLVVMILTIVSILAMLIPEVMVSVGGVWGALTVYSFIGDAMRKRHPMKFGITMTLFYNVPTFIVFAIAYVRW